MSAKLEAERYRLELRGEGKIMRHRKLIRTTLGDLIAAITDEVKPLVRDSSRLDMVVSYIINDVLARHRLRVHNRSLRKYPNYFARESIV